MLTAGLPGSLAGLLPAGAGCALPAEAAGLLPGAAEGAAFVAAVLVLNATPGVDFLLTVSRTLHGGARAGVAAALGISAGCVAHALAAAFGLAALLRLHPQAFVAIQWAGAAYLAWLGIGMLAQAGRGPAGPAAAPARQAAAATGATATATAEAATAATKATAATAETALAATSARRWRADFRAGVLTNLLNPKIALFFLAFVPQFVPAASPRPTLSFLLLAAAFVVQGTLFLLGLVALAARLARVQAPPVWRRALAAAGGGVFLALAARLLAARPQGG